MIVPKANAGEVASDLGLEGVGEFYGPGEHSDLASFVDELADE